MLGHQQEVVESVGCLGYAGWEQAQEGKLMLVLFVGVDCGHTVYALTI